MIDGTFAFVKGIGPARERQLWAKGIACWDDYPAQGTVLSKAVDDQIRTGIERMRTLVSERRFTEIAGLIPVREHWRFFPHVQDHACYLDIETTQDGQVTVIGVYDPVRGPRVYVRGHNLGDFVREPAPLAMITFNGESFDLPILERTFAEWQPPELHLDLRVVLGQLGERGGLKAIEERLGIGRPQHLRGVDGLGAINLWNEFKFRRSSSALRQLLEYNLYDVIQMRSLAELACARLAQRGGRSWQPEHPFLRGDILLDITRTVDAIVSEARRIEPDTFHDEERHSLRVGW